MNEEFAKWARTNMIDDTGYIDAYGRMEQAFLAGAAAMRDKCADAADKEADALHRHKLFDNEPGVRGVATVIRKV